MNLVRARYLLRRLTESPPSFLRERAALELRRRLDRFPAVRAARAKRRLGGRYDRWLPRLQAAAGALRGDLRAGLAAFGLGTDEVLELLGPDLDAGTWSCLGYGALPLVPGRWHVDDVHDARWPLEHFAGIDFVRPDERSDVKVPWEKSRMQWFLRAALADGVAPDESRRRRVLALVTDWIDENPYGMGVNWVSAMEVSIRATNLLVGFLLLEDRLEESTRRALLASFGEHLRYLRRFPESSDVQGNHHLASLLGVLALTLPSGDERARAELRRFEGGAMEQFSAEGLHIEFAPVYHRLTLDMLAVARALARRFLPAEPDGLTSLLCRGEAVCRSLAGEGGRVPIFGDADGGMVFDVGQAPRRFAHLSALVRGPGSLPAGAAGRAERLHAALLVGLAGGGAEGVAGLDPERSTAPPERIPPFVVLRAGREHLVARAGALGLGGRASHDHEDQLSFWFTHAGRDVVVESGSPPYTRSKSERRSGLVSTAHNVVSQAGKVRFVPGAGSVADSVRGGPVATVEAIESDPARVGVRMRLQAGTGSGTSSEDSGCPLEHLRELGLAGDGVLTLRDRFRFAQEADFESRLHFPVGAHVERIEERRCEVRLGGDAGSATLDLEGPPGIDLRREPYRFHPDYGAAEEASSVVVSGRASGWTELRVRITVRGSRSPGA